MRKPKHSNQHAGGHAETPEEAHAPSRRSFLKGLLGAAAAVTALPAVLSAKQEPEDAPQTHIVDDDEYTPIELAGPAMTACSSYSYACASTTQNSMWVQVSGKYQTDD